jgi:hypothetical protein
MTFEFKRLTKEEQPPYEPDVRDVQRKSPPTENKQKVSTPMLGGEEPIKESEVRTRKEVDKSKPDTNDHARLRQGRERHEGFDIGQYVQSVPMLFTRDGHNVWLGDQYRGGHAFLILGGPSFGDLLNQTFEFKGKQRTTREILDYPGSVTMCVNNSVRSYRPNLWCCVDSPTHFIKSVWHDPKITKFVPFCHTEKTIFDNESWKEDSTKVGDCPNVLFYRRNEHFQSEQFMTEDTFNWGNHKSHGGGRSVMLVAFRMLYHLGIRNLYLLGADFNMDENNKYHFEQDRSRGSQSGNNSTYRHLNERFNSIKPTLEAMGYNVWNCNPDSKLTAFPHMDFLDAANRACANLPIIETERTEGLYDREAKERQAKEKDAKVKTAKKVASKFSEEEKKAIKQKLDVARGKLNDLKAIAVDEPTEENEKKVREARAEFRKIEKEKNRIWGIVK